MLEQIWMRLLRWIGPGLPAAGLRRRALAAQGYGLGHSVYIGEGLLISDELERGSPARLSIGNRVAIAQRVTIVLSSHPNQSRLSPLFGHDRRAVIIEDDAWIGAGAVILPGVTIGEGAVVGAGAVVARSVPSWSVVTGNPARVQRTLEAPA